MIHSIISKLVLILSYWKYLDDTDPRYIIKNLLGEPCFSDQNRITIVREVGLLVEDGCLLLILPGELVESGQFYTTISPIGTDIISNLTDDSTYRIRITKKGIDGISITLRADRFGALKLAETQKDLRFSRTINRILNML